MLYTLVIARIISLVLIKPFLQYLLLNLIFHIMLKLNVFRRCFFHSYKHLNWCQNNNWNQCFCEEINENFKKQFESLLIYSIRHRFVSILKVLSILKLFSKSYPNFPIFQLFEREKKKSLSNSNLSRAEFDSRKSVFEGLLFNIWQDISIIRRSWRSFTLTNMNYFLRFKIENWFKQTIY
jgi:hypothetical protein